MDISVFFSFLWLEPSESRSWSWCRADKWLTGSSSYGQLLRSCWTWGFFKWRIHEDPKTRSLTVDQQLQNPSKPVLEPFCTQVLGTKPDSGDQPWHRNTQRVPPRTQLCKWEGSGHTLRYELVNRWLSWVRNCLVFRKQTNHGRNKQMCIHTVYQKKKQSYSNSTTPHFGRCDENSRS